MRGAVLAKEEEDGDYRIEGGEVLSCVARKGSPS